MHTYTTCLNSVVGFVHMFFMHQPNRKVKTSPLPGLSLRQSPLSTSDLPPNTNGAVSLSMPASLGAPQHNHALLLGAVPLSVPPSPGAPQHNHAGLLRGGALERVAIPAALLDNPGSTRLASTLRRTAPCNPA